MVYNQNNGKGTGYAFDPENKAPILTVSHMKLPRHEQPEDEVSTGRDSPMKAQ